MTSTDPETITFGPSHAQWHYHRPSKTYDLSRSNPPGQSFLISTTHGPPDTKISISPRLSALIVVDMQNYFLSPRCRDHPLGLAAAENLGQQGGVLEKCRDLGIQIIWLNWGLTAQDLRSMPASVQRGFARGLIAGTRASPGLGADLGNGQGRCLVAGSWNAEICEELRGRVRVGDVHCAKNRVSGLWSAEQPLWKYLVEAGKETLLFAGVNTDQCVLGTLTDACNAGWDCVMVEDCCATTTKGGREVCIHNIGNSYGFVVDSKTFTAGQLT